MLTLPLVVPALGLALLIGHFGLRRLTPVDQPGALELASVTVLPTALIFWATVGYASLQGQEGLMWPLVVIYGGVSFQFGLIALLWARPRRYRPVVAAFSFMITAYLTGGAWLTTLMALYNSWL